MSPRALSAPAATTVARHRSTLQANASFVAIDFETADSWRDSACSVGLVRVEEDRIVRCAEHLIRPPRPYFEFTYLHGITWGMVERKPPFGGLWPRIRGILDGAEFLAAHSAAFDRSVLLACCEAAGLEPPALPFLCTMRLARQTWGIRPTRLPDVCSRLRISLRHHSALSDAQACARIVLAARQAARPAARAPGVDRRFRLRCHEAE